MTARIVQLADAVTAALAAAAENDQFSRPFEVERNYADATTELSVANVTTLDVTPLAYDEADLVARSSLGYVATLRLGVRHKFSADFADSAGRIPLAKVDELVKLVEEIYEFLATRQFDEIAAWIGGGIPFIVAHDHLRQQRQFSAIIRARFRIEASV